MSVSCNAEDEVAMKRGRIFEFALVRNPYSLLLRVVEVSTVLN